jgi:hypothetical protein
VRERADRCEATLMFARAAAHSVSVLQFVHYQFTANNHGHYIHYDRVRRRQQSDYFWSLRSGNRARSSFTGSRLLKSIHLLG